MNIKFVARSSKAKTQKRGSANCARRSGIAGRMRQPRMHSGSRTRYKFFSVLRCLAGPFQLTLRCRRNACLPRRKDAVPLPLANPRAQETPVVMQTHLTAGEKVRDRCDGLFAAPSTGTHHQDKITQRKPSARLQDLAISFHIVPVSIRSNSNAIIYCEYLIHDPLCSYPILIHFETDR
jgi:hypothetical protein